MKNEEYKTQTEVIQWLDLNFPPMIRLVSPAAGFKLSMGLAMKMIRMGYQKGTSDLVLLEARGCYHGLIVEFKTLKGVLSPEQNNFLTLAAQKGFMTVVCRSALEAKRFIQMYLDIPF